MTKIRILIFLSTLIIVSILGVVASFYARGYKFDFAKLQFVPNGLLVINSEPNGAQIFVDDNLKTATNATLTLPPGTYDVTVKKEGYLAWSKSIVVEKEIVTQIDAVLFPAAPSLSAITFSGITNIIPSSDMTKIAYIVPPTKDNLDKAGLWITESTSLPIGFAREPKRIADGDFANMTLEWSPDSREILATTSNAKGVATAAYLFDTGQYTTLGQRTNEVGQIKTIKTGWSEKKNKKLTTQLAKLELSISEIISKKTTDIVFSPDENKILYTASESAEIPSGVVKPLPGASTQKQNRKLEPGKKYVYDIKEDRNFEIAKKDEPTFWLTTSAHLILPQKDKVIIMDYDGTNRQTVYQGSYTAPHAYPYSNASKLVILTNLGSTNSLTNLYSLNLK
jgi:hypothetical protein